MTPASYGSFFDLANPFVLCRIFFFEAVKEVVVPGFRATV